ncbi:hypothetical protein H4R34_001059 [Dimargaris verticillata]|uniref:RlpA-like double-psi beta-barrel-protein domain-containing protein-containing protein n=1 Tax=Dimargaris verticillata TaxID=2761393 RepID=A0A9W8EB98_9FUNG|nr:hypothetical protein H4R34_001059 [Dimargaris verticillata]
MIIGLLASLVQGRVESPKQDQFISNSNALFDQDASKLPLAYSPSHTSEFPEAFADDEELAMRMDEVFDIDCAHGHCTGPSNGALVVPLQSIPPKARKLIKPYITDEQDLGTVPQKEAVVDGCTRDFCVQSLDKVLVLPTSQLPPKVLAQFLTLVNQKPLAQSARPMSDELDDEDDITGSLQRSVNHATLPPIAPPKREQEDKILVEPQPHDIKATEMAAPPPLVPEDQQVMEPAAPKNDLPQQVHTEAPQITTTKGDNRRSGEGTYYEPKGIKGACGTPLTDDDAVVAMNFADFGGDANPNNSMMCGQQVEIKTDKGVARAKVMDKCKDCKPGDLDMTPSVFKQIAELATGRVPIEWSFVPSQSEGIAAA